MQSRKVGFKSRLGKYDGTRVIIIKEGEDITLHNRHNIVYSVRLPEVVKAAKAIEGDVILDGEACYFNEKGEEEFVGSQRRCSTEFPDHVLRQAFPITYMAFDILRLNGEWLTDKPYWKRKKTLRETVEGSELRYVSYRRDVENAWREVLEKDREGLILKDFNSRYMIGERSWSWLKIKHWRFCEAEVVGYTKGVNSRAPFFGSLVLARDGKFIGCVGSGFNDYELMKVRDILLDSPAVSKPFPDEVVGESYIAVKIGLRVLVKYYKVNAKSGVMRFPIFQRTL